MGQLIWFLIQLIILPLKILYSISEFFFTSILLPLIIQGPKVIFVILCILGTLMYIFGALAK